MRDLIIQMNILQSLLSLFYESVRSLAFIVKELCGLDEFIQLEIGYHPHSLGMVNSTQIPHHISMHPSQLLRSDSYKQKFLAFNETG